MVSSVPRALGFFGHPARQLAGTFSRLIERQDWPAAKRTTLSVVTLAIVAGTLVALSLR